MALLSVVIPSRNERFLLQTIDDLFAKAVGDIEVIAVLEGYWPDPILPDRQQKNHTLIYIHHGKPHGMRAAINSAVAIAKGKFIMKVDAHCMFADGFDEALKADCEKDWVVVPRRYSLDPENWCRKDKHPIDYLWAEPPLERNNNELNVRVWNDKNYDIELQKLLIDDVFTFQGSCWFMRRDYFYELDLMDDINYGTFRKEPQEITFKAWLSGGRVIRNKKTWYAHLHKGKKYGRGYSHSKRDYKKGDVYLTNWLTNTAWDKQTIPFRWLIDKFNMPEWDVFDWDKWESEYGQVKQIEQKSKRVTRIYQNIPLDGVVWQNANRLDSKFWNKGKWGNFIAPHLPEDCTDQAFVDMGCNAGLFLKLAEDHGFRDIVGVEKDRTPVNEGLRYRNSIGYHYNILKRTLGGKFGENGNFNIDELPIADFTVMSTFHYYIDINSWIKYVDRLMSKTRHVLIVSRPRMKRLHWIAYSSIEALRGYFAGWEEINMIDGIPQDNDPSPRNLFSIVFKSPILERVALSDINIRESKDDSMYVAMKDFAERIIEDDAIDPFETPYYDRWVKRKQGRWASRHIKKFVQSKFNMIVDIKDNGPKDPIIVDYEYKLSDGGHRMVTLEALGYKSVIVRKI